MAKPRVQIVWYKRDLRIVDHRPLVLAAERGAVLPLYVVEPMLWAQPDTAGRHWAFIADCLRELCGDLAALGQPLVVRVGETLDTFRALGEQLCIESVWSHEETGNAWTFARDRRLANWLRERGIPWQELPQNGVVRGLRSRQGWSRQWEARMAQPLLSAPEALPPIPHVAPGLIPDAGQLGLLPDPCAHRQVGGRTAALRVLESFLDSRGERYRSEMSSPLTAYRGCSRLSTHLAYGSVSMREVVQRTRRRRRQVKALSADRRGDWSKSLSAFEGRLHWHCHFMQKLEAEPRIEFENLHTAADGLREGEFDVERFQRWCTGHTGFPFVDACMRALADTGWINFRMRAMLVSFAAYHLWLHWREPAHHLACLFTDYEPGIHYSQIQMQSGTTGINTFRIYNPVKQSRDQDPEGILIRQWVPELSGVEDVWIHEPWRMSTEEQRRCDCRIGSSYPAPVVDHEAAARQARQRMGRLRRGQARDEAREIFDKHGSRRRPPRRR